MKALQKESVKAVSYLWLGTFFGAGLAFLTQIMMARHLTVESFGVFSAVLSLVLLFVPLAGFGVAQFWLKIFGQEGWAAIRWIPNSLRFVTYSTFLVSTVLLAWAAWGPHDYMSRLLITVLAFHIVGQISLELVSSRLQLEERYAALAAWQLWPHCLRFLLVVLVLLVFEFKSSPLPVAIVYGFVATCLLAGAIKFIGNMKEGRFNLKGHPVCQLERERKAIEAPSWLVIAKMAWPFGLASLAHLIYYQSDIVFLKYMQGDSSAGIYNICFLILSAVYLFPGVVYQKFFVPKLHRWAVHDRGRLGEVFRTGNYVLLISGVASGMVIYLLSEPLIRIFFGTGYGEASEVLRVLAFSVPTVFMAFGSGAVLVTQNHMLTKVKLMFGVACLNVVLNFLLIPPYGVYGAAIATVISNFVLAGLYFYAAKKFVFKQHLAER